MLILIVRLSITPPKNIMNNGDFSGMNNDFLADMCRSETEKFFHKLAHDTRYCFELFCRAYRDISDEALTYIYDIYVPILAKRATKHGAFEKSSRDALGFARSALVNFYLVVRRRRFTEMFFSLPQVIKYLHICVSSEVLQDVRKHQYDVELDVNPFIASYDTGSDSEETLDYSLALFSDEDDRLLFILRFVLEMKPADIAKAYPDKWKNAREVTVQLYRIRQILRQDPYLRSLVDLDDEDEDEADDSDSDQ